MGVLVAPTPLWHVLVLLALVCYLGVLVEGLRRHFCPLLVASSLRLAWSPPSLGAVCIDDQTHDLDDRVHPAHGSRLSFLSFQQVLVRTSRAITSRLHFRMMPVSSPEAAQVGTALPDLGDAYEAQFAPMSGAGPSAGAPDPVLANMAQTSQELAVIQEAPPASGTTTPKADPAPDLAQALLGAGLFRHLLDPALDLLGWTQETPFSPADAGQIPPATVEKMIETWQIPAEGGALGTG